MLKYFIALFTISSIILNLSESKIFIPQYNVVYKNQTFEITNKIWTTEAVDKDDPEICSWRKHKFAVNEVYRPIGVCQTVTCVESGKVELIDCGSVTHDCSSIGMDMTKRHPHCCHRIACTDSDGQNFIYNPLTPGEGDLVV